MMTQPTLNTARLLLRPFAISDAPDVQRLAGAREVADTTLNIPHPYEDGMAEQWIASHRAGLENGTSVHFAVINQADNTLVGCVSLMCISVALTRVELGYWIGVAFWGNGFCTEASRAVLDYAFNDLGLNRVWAEHITRNPASGRVMQKLGMTYEGRLRQHTRKWGVPEDVEVYGLLRDEWRGDTAGRRCG